MRLKFKQPPRTPIGIDVGGRCVKAVQLQRAAEGKGWRLAAAAVMPREQVAAAPENGAIKPPTASEVAALAAVLDRQGFSGRDVVLAAPADRLLSGILELPPRSAGVPIEQLARVELARTHRCAPDSIEMGCWDLPTPARAGKSTHVMAVACAHADADALLDPFEAAGLNVCGLDAPVLAMARACEPVLAPPPDITAVLDVGWRGASLALLLGGTVVYSRLLAEAGVGRLRDALTARLRIDAEVADYLLAEVGFRTNVAASEGATETAAPPDAPGDWQVPADAQGALGSFGDGLVRELRASFSYAVHQYANTAVTRLLLVGGGAAIPGLAGYAAAALKIDVRPVAPAELVECPPGGAAALAGTPLLTGALGLAQFPAL